MELSDLQTPSVTRRDLLRAGLGLAAASALPIWVRADVTTPTDPLLMVVFLRGAADGLHLVPPIGDPRYASVRGSLALPEPLGLPERFPGRVDFGLHPALEKLLPLAERGELAIVHAAGSPDASRSHFDAQDQMEAGRPGSLRVHDGWLARALSTTSPPDPFSSLALAGGLPLSLRGSGAFAIESAEGFGIPAATRAARDALAATYDWKTSIPGIDPVKIAGQTALSALADFESRVDGAASSTDRQARRRWRRGTRKSMRGGLAEAAGGLDTLLDAGLGIRAVCLESGGWDTHRSQGLEQGAFARRAADLGAGLAKLAELGRRRGRWTVVVMTEFGRTVKPNGSGGSDHGHGSVMLVAGSGVRAGVHGDWPGLSPSSLYQGRDLAVATDYRSVLTEVLQAHLGGAAPRTTFPGFAAAPLGVIA